MGIPFYFKNLISRFPDIIKRPLKKQCTHLYLDFNCIIHTSAAKLLATAASKNETPLSFQERVIRESLEYIDLITKTVEPTELLYIAVDGTCPRAKMQQQRKRRFMSIWRNEKISELKKNMNRGMKKESVHMTEATAPSLWDSNIATPGTEFMNRFDKLLDEYIANAKKPYRIMGSNSSEFGEGEHKIFDYITHSGIDTETTSHVIYGLDADLIMLSMVQALSKSEIMLLREVPEFNVPGINSSHSIRSPDLFLLLDINSLKKALASEFLLNDHNRIADYVMLCVLVGNDFVPPLSYLKIKNDGIDILLRIYHKLAQDPCRLNNRLVTQNSTGQYELDFQFLTDLLQALSLLENQCIEEADASYYNKRSYLDSRNASIESLVDNYPNQVKFPKCINVTQPGWRLSYYKRLFHYHNTDVVQKACEKYTEGIMWVFNYYFVKQFNSGWYYPFSYSPTCLDLYNFLLSTCDQHETRMNTISNTHMTHKEFADIMKNPHMHLLMVLPPLSAKILLPPELVAITSDASHGCIHFYPTTFDITLYLKSYLWECSAILPDIDIQKVFKAYTRAINQKK